MENQALPLTAAVNADMVGPRGSTRRRSQGSKAENGSERPLKTLRTTEPSSGALRGFRSSSTGPQEAVNNPGPEDGAAGSRGSGAALGTNATAAEPPARDSITPERSGILLPPPSSWTSRLFGWPSRNPPHPQPPHLDPQDPRRGRGGAGNSVGLEPVSVVGEGVTLPSDHLHLPSIRRTRSSVAAARGASSGPTAAPPQLQQRGAVGMGRSQAAMSIPVDNSAPVEGTAAPEGPTMRRKRSAPSGRDTEWEAFVGNGEDVEEQTETRVKDGDDGRGARQGRRRGTGGRDRHRRKQKDPQQAAAKGLQGPPTQPELEDGAARPASTTATRMRSRWGLSAASEGRGPEM